MTPLRKIYISIIIFGILSIFLIAFCIFPLFKEIKNNSKEFILEKEKMILLAQEKENLKKLEDFYNTYQSDFNKIENLFIDPETPIEFINFLEQTASTSQSRLEISSMTKKIEKEDPWPSLSFQFSVSGTFPNFLKFLRKLETGPYLIEFIDLNITKLSEKEIKPEESLTNIRATLSIKVFTR